MTVFHLLIAVLMLVAPLPHITKASEPPPPCCREESGGYFKIKIIVMSPIPPCTFTRSLRQHDGRPECLLEMLVLPLSSLYLRFISFAFTSMGISLVF